MSLKFILLFINDNIGIKMEYSERCINILKKIPLKFIDIDFDDNYFTLNYGFPYIKTLVESTKNILDVKKYFEQKMYEKNFYSQYKGIYFEDSVNRSIKEGKIYIKTNTEVKKKKIYNLIVNNILDMKENNIEKNVNTIINKIKNNENDNSSIEKNYKDYINDRIDKISEVLETNSNDDTNLNKNLVKALEEDLIISQNKKNNLETINDPKKLDKYGKRIIAFYNEDFKNGNILIEQTQTNGRCLDSAFLFGHKNKKSLYVYK